MTAPDDLARTLAEHFWSATDDETCTCGWKSSNWDDLRLRWEMGNCEQGDNTPQIDRATREFTQHQAAHLASVVSRRDTEFRVAIKEAEDEPARCKVWRGGVLIFSGRSDVADLSRRDTDLRTRIEEWAETWLADWREHPDRQRIAELRAALTGEPLDPIAAHRAAIATACRGCGVTAAHCESLRVTEPDHWPCCDLCSHRRAALDGDTREDDLAAPSSTP